VTEVTDVTDVTGATGATGATGNATQLFESIAVGSIVRYPPPEVDGVLCVVDL
jgi:hypothetical protein